jgi:hypothetical protein
MYILATASNQMKPAEAGRAIAVMLAAISLRNCFASTSTPPGSEWAQLHEQMDPDPVVLRFSPDEWNKLASGLVFSPDDLSMIEAGLGALGKFSKSTPHRQHRRCFRGLGQENWRTSSPDPRATQAHAW